ncbi:MAG: PBP1A family penicillin-binding protein [Treponema sp.]|jgi:penicillin-binding protein 1A|nr:PBP1A family penicillin-binding protein [Treponema sp.]
MGNYSGNAFISGLLVKFFAALTIILVAVIGIGLGLSLAETANIKNQENFIELSPALPTKILDINGTLITEFAADEKRELVSMSELPRHLIHAVLAREDPDFYNHKGFSVRAIARAAAGQILRKNWGGGSTITQQVAGSLYTDRRERSYKRKIKELWWAFQMERRYSKNEILEIYLNYMPMGPGTYGVEAASKYFFDHSAKEVTLAEAAVLAVLLSGPSRFNPLDNPNEAMNRQHFVLERMIDFGYAIKEDAEASFAEYWASFDYTRPSVAAYYRREDKAPWFSEYVRRELESHMYGAMDYYRDGYIVHTTMDFRHQEAAEKFLAEGLVNANRAFLRSSGRNHAQAERVYIPIVEMLTLCFGLDDISAAMAGQNEVKSLSRYTKMINPVVDMAALAFGVPELKEITNKGFAALKVSTEQNVVEGALISIENETGYITAIVGGSKYDESNQLIRASQGSIQPGSAFKPLYYSAAIDSRKMTAASLIYDVPMVFHNEDRTPYIPLNFRGEWKGSVLLYDALAQSMNVPSLKVLDTIGFDAAIDRSAALLDYTDPATIRKLFPRVYPLGMGIISTSPLRMARAFAIFGNQGRSVTPISIRTVEDRNGRVVLDIERDLRQRQRRMGNAIQVVSPQNAYIMTKVLEKTVDEGTLAHGAGYGSKFTFRDADGKSFKMPMAGKTGTPQNWSDAWTVGFSPYYTTAIWYGFDKPGNSLGVDLTGSTLTGPVWGDYMREIHKGLRRKDFARPSGGIIDVTVCAKSGMLKTAFCNQREVTLPFLEGTQPAQYCDIHGSASPYETKIPVSTTQYVSGIYENDFISSLTMPVLPLDLFPELNERPAANTNRNNSRTTNTNNRSTSGNTRSPAPPPLFGNPFLDDSPRDNPINRSAPDAFPETIIQFVPETEAIDSRPVNNDYDDDLPGWNPLD